MPAQATSWFPSTPTPSGSYFLCHDRVADKTRVEEGNPAFADCCGDLCSGMLNESSWDTFWFITQQQFSSLCPSSMMLSTAATDFCALIWAPQHYRVFFVRLEISNLLNFALKIVFVYFSLPLFLFFCCRELLAFEMCPVVWGSRCIYGSFCDDV